MTDELLSEELSKKCFKIEFHKLWLDIKCFEPLRGFCSEAEYEIALTHFLKRKFKVEPQKRIGNFVIDAFINDKFGLEIKYCIDRNELNRLVGQILNYVEYPSLKIIFVVLFNTCDGLVEELRRKIKPHVKNVIIVSKKTVRVVYDDSFFPSYDAELRRLRDRKKKLEAVR